MPPIYEYDCVDCKWRFEALRKIDDASPLNCPACNSHHLQQILSAPNFNLKGDGFYKPSKSNKDNLE